MKTFVDAQNRTWSVVVNVATVKRVRSLADADLLDPQSYQALAEDPVRLCDVLFAICKPEADGRQVSDESFGEALAGDVLDAAIAALLDEIVDFFPKGRRQVIRLAVAKLTRLQEAVTKVQTEKLESMDIEAMADALTRGALSTSTPGSPASTPIPGPSGS